MMWRARRGLICRGEWDTRKRTEGSARAGEDKRKLGRGAIIQRVTHAGWEEGGRSGGLQQRRSVAARGGGARRGRSVNQPCNHPPTRMICASAPAGTHSRLVSVMSFCACGGSAERSAARRE